MLTRIALFLATNLAILIVLNISMRVLGIEPYLNQNGLNLTSLLIFAAAFGMIGSFISLAMSKSMAKRFSGARVIESPGNRREQWLVETVRAQSEQAGIGMPEVAIFDSPQVNAFATGMNRNNALVAVSTGLLDAMTVEEAEAVVGHEVSHVANGDMITLALIQGVVNTFVIFLSRVVGQIVDKAVFKNEQGHGPAFWVTAIVAEVTDDKALPKAERKRLQVEHAPHKSPDARLVKIADKTSNLTDIVNSAPGWPLERKQEYFDWAKSVVDPMRGINAELEAAFDAIYAKRPAE